MTCPKCEHQQIENFGNSGKARIARYRCKDCGATFAETGTPRGSINGHATDFRRILQVFTLLTEGMSIRAISRVARNACDGDREYRSYWHDQRTTGGVRATRHIRR